MSEYKHCWITDFLHLQYTDACEIVCKLCIQSVAYRGAEGASRPGRHFRRGGTSEEMLKFTLKWSNFRQERWHFW